MACVRFTAQGAAFSRPQCLTTTTVCTTFRGDVWRTPIFFFPKLAACSGPSRAFLNSFMDCSHIHILIVLKDVSLCVPFYYGNHRAINWLCQSPQRTSNEAPSALCVSWQHFKRPVIWQCFAGGLARHVHWDWKILQKYWMEKIRHELRTQRIMLLKSHGWET